MSNEFKQHSSRILRNLNGDYNFELKTVLLTGWKNTMSQIGLFVQMLVLVFVIGLLMVTLYLSFAGITSPEQINLQQVSLFELFAKIILAPLFAALMMQGAKAHIKQPGTVMNLFMYLSRAIPILIVTLLISVLSMLGFSLYIIPGIYVVIATGFAVMLVADNRCRPFTAITLSVRMVNKYLPQFLALYAVFFVLLVLTSFTFGVGLLILMPYYYSVKGMLYCELFGYGDENDPDQEEQTGESTFEA